MICLTAKRFFDTNIPALLYLSTRRRQVKDIEWSSTLSIEVEEIVEDHHKLVDIFDILNHSLENGD